MFDVSALLSLKPAAPIADQMTAPGGEALQTGSFSRILSTQLEVSTPVPGEPVSPSADLAATTQPAGNRQPAGKILPDTLPVAAEQAEAAPAEAEPAEAAEIKRWDSLLARHVELASTRAVAKPVRSADIPAPPSEAPELADDQGARAPASAETAVPPPALLALVQPAALAPTPLAPLAATSAAPAPTRALTQPTATVGAQADRETATAAATASLPSALPVTALPNAAAPSGMPPALLTVPQPAGPPASPIGVPLPTTASTIALVAAQAQQQAAPSAPQPMQATSPASLFSQPVVITAIAGAPIAPVAPQTGEQAAPSAAAPIQPAPPQVMPSTQPAVIAANAESPIAPTAAQAREQAAPPATAPIQQMPTPATLSARPTVLAGMAPALVVPPLIPLGEGVAQAAPEAAAPLTSVFPTKAADAKEAPEIAEHPAGRPVPAAHLQAVRADAKPVAGRSEDASPASGSATAPAATSPATERGLPAASASQPATILPDIRQPVVGPSAAAVTPAALSETPQDFAALVDRLIAARESAAPQPVKTTISHVEFGRISLDFRQEGGALTVAMNSADPGFAPAVAAAVAADKFVIPASDAQQPSQVQAAAQAQASSQPQNQGHNPSQAQQQSQSQSPSGNSGQLHQESSGQRNADGSNAQGRNGQERPARYQSNPSQPGRDNGSPQSRNGTYA